MSLIDDIKTDREAGTPGPWKFGRAAKPQDGAYNWGIKGYVDGDFEVIAETFGRSAQDIYPPAEVNARRIARVPELEQAYLDLREKADALADAIARSDPWEDIDAAMTAYRGATS